MPKIVDHEERRTEVLDATWRVIGRHGLEGATVRRIADEAGYSNGVLGHYFTNKDDILVSAHQLAFARASARIARVQAEHSGLTALRLSVFEALPLDADGLLEAQVDVSFLGHTVGNDDLRAVRRASNEAVHEQWREFVEASRATGELVDDVDATVVVDELMAIIESVSIGAILAPDYMTPERQMMLADRTLARYSTDAGDAAFAVTRRTRSRRRTTR